MAQESGRSQRKLFRITDSTFQRQFTLFCFTIVSITTSISLVGIIVAVYQVTSVMKSGNPMSIDQLHDLLRDQVKFAWAMVALVSVLNLAIASLMSHFFSQRASGLILRLTKTLNEIADGRDVQVIRPRKNDFFMDLVAAVNRLIEKKQ